MTTNNKTKIPYLITPKGLSLTIKGKPFTIDTQDKRYDAALKLVREGNLEGLTNLLDKAIGINNKYNRQGLSIINGVVTYTNKEGLQDKLPDALIKSLVAMFEQDEESVQPLLMFWEKLKLNPSYRINNCLFDFITHNNIVINEIGNLIMYKIVKRTDKRDVFLDLYTGTIKNKLGQIVEVPRNQVDDNIEKTCSQGLKRVASY